jgi:hypothetical protein
MKPRRMRTTLQVCGIGLTLMLTATTYAAEPEIAERGQSAPCDVVKGSGRLRIDSSLSKYYVAKGKRNDAWNAYVENKKYPKVGGHNRYQPDYDEAESYCKDRGKEVIILTVCTWAEEPIADIEVDSPDVYKPYGSIKYRCE